MSDPKNPIPIDTGEPTLLETLKSADEGEGVPSAVADIGSSFCNGFWVTVTSGLVRIAFSESIDGHPPRYRWSVVLPLEDASDLARVIQELIGDFQDLNRPPPEGAEETGDYDEETGEYK